MEPTSIGGAWTFTPALHRDDRGYFLEWFQAGELSGSLGYWPEIAQANCSVSRRGVIRGVHFASVPPGQAKYVTCVSGAVLDVIVDVRVGSPSYGRWEAVRLDDTSRRAVFLAEGLGHAFTALSDEATVIYLCSTPYSPGREHGVHPLDPDIGIEWPADIRTRALRRRTPRLRLSKRRARRGCCPVTLTARPTWVACARQTRGTRYPAGYPAARGGPVRGEEFRQGAMQARSPLADRRNASPAQAP